MRIEVGHDTKPAFHMNYFDRLFELKFNIHFIPNFQEWIKYSSSTFQMNAIKWTERYRIHWNRDQFRKWKKSDQFSSCTQWRNFGSAAVIKQHVWMCQWVALHLTHCELKNSTLWIYNLSTIWMKRASKYFFLFQCSYLLLDK